MAKDIMDGGEGGEGAGKMRDDTAKATRGTTWALISVGAFVIIAAILFITYFLRSATDNKPSETPGQIEQRTK